MSLLGDKLEFGKPLAPLTTFGTGGPARYFITVTTAQEASKAVSAAVQLGLPFTLIGGGSNLLVSDSGFDGLVIRMAVMGLKLIDETTVDCGAGEDLQALVLFAADNSLSGMEFATGIWGTVGGAIYGNAGAYGGDIGSVISRVTLVDPAGRLKTVSKEYCRFGYRDSILKSTGEVLTEARVSLKRDDPASIRKRIDDIMDKRNAKFPRGGKTAGCFFKNIPDPAQEFGKLPAGRLLEEVGAKKMAVGGAQVYDKHANVIINSGNATSKDIRQLADKLKEKVLDAFGIKLEEEIIQIGDF